jgi:hypothetical protein
MDDETIEQQVEQAAEHADRSIEHREEERRLEGKAETTDRSRKDALELEAERHREAADDEERAAEQAASGAG